MWFRFIFAVPSTVPPPVDSDDRTARQLDIHIPRARSSVTSRSQSVGLPGDHDLPQERPDRGPVGGRRDPDQAVRRRNSTPGGGDRDGEDAGAPGQRRPRVRADRRGQQQAAQRLDHRRHRLVLREALDPRRHRVDGDERAARVGQEHDHEREAVGGLGRLRDQADRRRQPGHGEHEREQDADGGEPVQRRGVGPEPDRERDPEHEHGRGGVAQRAGRHVPDEDRRPADVHRAEAVDDASVMSWLTVTAVVAEPKPAHSRITPGTT